MRAGVGVLCGSVPAQPARRAVHEPRGRGLPRAPAPKPQPRQLLHQRLVPGALHQLHQVRLMSLRASTPEPQLSLPAWSIGFSSVMLPTSQVQQVGVLVRADVCSNALFSTRVLFVTVGRPHCRLGQETRCRPWPARHCGRRIWPRQSARRLSASARISTARQGPYSG